VLGAASALREPAPPFRPLRKLLSASGLLCHGIKQRDTRTFDPSLPAVTVHTGSSNVTPAQYMQAVAALAPDVWVALSDDVPSDCRWAGICQGPGEGGWPDGRRQPRSSRAVVVNQAAAGCVGGKMCNSWDAGQAM
jgi:hypothetical protein